MFLFVAMAAAIRPFRRAAIRHRPEMEAVATAVPALVQDVTRLR
jgi:hypothetical protein